MMDKSQKGTVPSQITERPPAPTPTKPPAALDDSGKIWFGKNEDRWVITARDVGMIPDQRRQNLERLLECERSRLDMAHLKIKLGNMEAASALTSIQAIRRAIYLTEKQK